MMISAHEVATYCYCPERWRLEYGLGLPPANRRAMAAGTRHHARKGAVERVAGLSIGLGRWLIALAVLAALWMLWR